MTAHAPRVVGIAVGQAPGTQILGGLGLQRDEVGNQLAIGRIDLASDRRLRAIEQVVLAGLIQLVGAELGQLFLETRVKHVFLSRHGDETLHLLKNFVDRELGWDRTLAFSQFQALDDLRELQSELVEALDVVLGIGRVVDLMRVGHEIRQARLDAKHLVDRKVVVAESLAFDLIREEELERVIGELALVGMPGRGVIELGAVEIRPRRQDTHAAEHLRALQGKLKEGSAIKPVDLVGLEVPDMHECDARHDNHQQEQTQHPFQKFSHVTQPGQIVVESTTDMLVVGMAIGNET